MYPKFKYNLILLFVSFSVILQLIGCTRTLYLVPDPQSVNTKRVQEFKVNQIIKIENIQSSTEIIPLGTLNVFNSFEGNLNEWTSKAIELLSNELQTRGGEIKEDGLKVLKLSVTKAAVEQRAWQGTRCILTLHVETGEGYKTDYFVTNNSGGGLVRASGGAITLAITDLLKDENILSYLK